MKWFIVHYQDDYADELDLYGFRIFDEDQWNRALRRMRDRLAKGPLYYFFGTNEEVIFESYEDLLSHFTVNEVTQHELNIIEKLFLEYERGLFPPMDGN